MEFTTAKDVTANLTGLQAHSFGTAIVQKRTPGAFTYEFGKGSLALEAVISYLLAGSSTAPIMARNVDALAEILLDDAKLTRVWNELFPSMTQFLSPDQHLFSVNDIQGAFTKVLGAKAITGATSTMTEIMVEALSGTRFVSRTEGYSYREMRTVRFPDYDDMVREFLRAEVISHMKAEPLRLRFDAKKFSPVFLLTEFKTMCSRLGRALSKIGYNYDALHDSLYAVYTYLTCKGSIATRLPAEVANSGELAELVANVTFVAAAYKMAIKQPRDGNWNLRNNMAKAIQILNLSDRYDIVSIATAVGHCRYSNVVDPRSNLLGGVLSFAAPIWHKPEVALIHEHKTNGVGLLQAVRLERYSESFNGLISPVQGWDVNRAAHDIVESVVSVARISELDDDPRSTLWTIGALDPLDLIHIAVHKADRVFLPKSKSTETSLDNRLVFEKDLKGLRLFAASVPFEGVVQTADAATLLLCCQSFDNELTFDMSGQAVPDFVWDTLIVNDQADIVWDYNGKRKIDVDVAGTTVSALLDMTDLTRNIARDTARMMRLDVTAPIMDAAFTAIHEATTWVASHPSVASNPGALARLEAQVGHQLFSMYERMSESPLFQDVLSQVIRRMAGSVPPAKRDDTYMTMEQMNYRLQISVELVGYIYEHLELFSRDAEMGISKIHAANMFVWKKADFFNRMIGASRSKRIGA